MICWFTLIRLLFECLFGYLLFVLYFSLCCLFCWFGFDCVLLVLLGVLGGFWCWFVDLFLVCGLLSFLCLALRAVSVDGCFGVACLVGLLLLVGLI